MRRLRYTVRGLMVIVALAGILAGGWVMHARSVEYRKLAGSNAGDEEFYRVALSGRFKLGHPSYARTFKRRLDYHRAMREKYDRAARYPWLPAGADPPDPGWD